MLSTQKTESPSQRRHFLRRHRIVALTVVAVLAIVLGAVVTWRASTGSSPVSAAKSRNSEAYESERRDVDSIDFDKPFIDGTTIESVSAVAADLAFTAWTPDTLGSPQAIFTHQQASRDTQAVALSYDTKNLGRFLIYEMPAEPTISQETFDASVDDLVKQCADPTRECEGSWSTMKLSDGSKALLTAGDRATGLTWTHAGDGGVLYQVVGPSATFSSEAATIVAEALVRAGG